MTINSMLRMNLISASALFLASALAWGEQFDRTADLPDLAKAVSTAASAMADYKKAKQNADAAAKRLAVGSMHLSKDKRNAAKAADLLQLEGGLSTMLETLDVFYDALKGIANQMEGGISNGLRDIRGQLDDLVAGFSGQIAEKEQVSALLLGLSEIGEEAFGEGEAGELNSRLDELAQQKKIAKKMQESGERIGWMTENIEHKVETIKAVASFVEARIAELRCESMFVKVLKEDHKVSMVIDGLTGAEKFGDPTALFDNKPSRYLDEVMGREARRGERSGNERAILKARKKTKGGSNE